MTDKIYIERQKRERHRVIFKSQNCCPDELRVHGGANISVTAESYGGTRWVRVLADGVAELVVFDPGIVKGDIPLSMTDERALPVGDQSEAAKTLYALVRRARHALPGDYKGLVGELAELRLPEDGPAINETISEQETT